MPWLIGITLLLALWFHYFMRLRNPYHTTLYIGKKGSGKSTNIVKKLVYYSKHPKHRYYDYYEHKWHEEEWHIYSNVDVKGFEQYYTKFRLEDLGTKFIPESPSIVFADEINLLWDNRQFKNFPQGTQDFFRFNRRYRSRCFLYSQTFDCDKKIRELASRMVLIQSFLTIFSLEKDISKVITISEDKQNADSQVIDRLEFVPWWRIGSRRFTFLPKWIDKHQSYIKAKQPYVQKIVQVNEIKPL